MKKEEKKLLLERLEELRSYLAVSRQFAWAAAVRDAKLAIRGKKKAKAQKPN